MFFSPSAQQAMRALIYLARQASNEPVLVREIAAAEGIPHPFLSKLLLSLRNRGIVKSTRGPGGGYMLARPPEHVVLTEVVETFDGSKNLGNSCILGLAECGDVDPCALHELWRVFRTEFQDKISSLTLRDVAETMAAKRRCTPQRDTRLKSRRRSGAARRRH